MKQIEELFEPYRALIAGLSDVEFMRKVLHGYHAAYFSCRKLQLSLKTMQHFSGHIFDTSVC